MTKSNGGTAMNRDELIKLTYKIYEAKKSRLNMELQLKIDEYLKILDQNVPHPDVVDLIYWNSEDKALTPEQVVDTALSYDWKANQRVICSAGMEELLKDCEPTGSKTSYVQLMEHIDALDARSKWEMRGTNAKKIAKGNKIDLDFCQSVDEMAEVVKRIESHLKEKHPNRMFQSYFVYKNKESSFTFHAESNSASYIADEKIAKLNYPIRKNTF